MVGQNFQPYYVPSPGVGIMMIISIVLAIGAIALLLQHRRTRAVPRGTPLLAYGLAFGATTGTVLLILINAFTQKDVQVAPEIARALMPPGPWQLAVQSAQWDLALFAVVWGAQLLTFIALLFPDKLRGLLPDAARLDRAAYYSILVAFALVAVVLVTGALWAHYAWGRYWGWDPKETGALVIWITYAIYLHTRVTYGWVGVPSAVIGVLGFFIIIAGFLGVNLGWFADGLHSYGSA
jgi:ABC-type transport system involved in cytochrome c biogenesis permease subunit